MTEQLVWEDYLTIGLYFAVVLAVGLWSTFRPNRGNAKGYFLAGKSMHWIPVGASIYASNIGAPMFVGMSGTAAASGFAVTFYEWHAVYFLIALGWMYVPVYVACGAFTTPEYLKKRFGGRRIQLYLSIVSLVNYILRNISLEVYSGAIFMRQLLGWNTYLCVVCILAVTAVYTIAGGLASVIYTDTLQTGILIAGAIVVTSMSLNAVGGWHSMIAKYPYAAANYTLANQTFYKCGMPREDAFHIFRDATDGDIPWPGALFGLSVLGMYVWCQDQIIVQRALAAKNMTNVKAGTLFAAFLKLFGFLLFVIPGMLSRILFPDDIACADPDKCYEFCNNRAGCTNLAYPLLVMRILPAGVRGLMLAALLAALMSSLTSIFNSASSIVTLDIWRQFRTHAKQMELMVVGRVTILVLIGVSILWIPILEHSQGGLLWFYMVAVSSYLLPPFCMIYVLGFFWKRTTEQGAFWGLIIGLVIGVIRMGLDFATPAPDCGSDQPDNRFSVVAQVDFLHFSIILAAVSAAAIAFISILTKPMPAEKLHRVTWWTRLDEEQQDLSDDEKLGASADISIDEEGEHSDQNNISSKLDTQMKVTTRCARICRNWLCGTTTVEFRTEYERALNRRAMTSLAEGSTSRIILNAVAIGLAVGTAFLLGFFG